MNEEEPLITQEVIDALKARDERLRDIDLMYRLKKELNESIAIAIILERAEEDASVALEELAVADPNDVKRIIALQARIYRARFIRRTLNMVFDNGAAAEDSIREDDD